MKKAIIAGFLLTASIASAQTEAPPAGASLSLPGIPGSLDLAALVKSLHPVYVFDQHRDSLAGADIHALTLKSADGVEWAHLCTGVVWDTDKSNANYGRGGGEAAVRFRLDNIAAKALGTSWAKLHVNSISIPEVEAGPFAGYISGFGLLYGATAALAF